MNIEVRLFASDFNALKISASVVLSRALVASSHNLRVRQNQDKQLKEIGPTFIITGVSVRLWVSRLKN